MPKKRSIAKRHRPIPIKERHPAVLEQIEKDVIATGVTLGERELMLARALADTEERTRGSSLVSLRAWLKDNGDKLVKNEMDRLWKALFYCVWMTDKRARISAIVKDIVLLEDILGMKHIRALFRCMVREWMGIDKHRVDKYYELLNVAIEHCADKLSECSSDESLRKWVEEFISCISEDLIAKVNRGGKGVLMHVVDKWVDIVLNPVLLKACTISRNEVHWCWDRLLQPFLELLGSADARLNAVKRKFEERVVSELGAFITSETFELTPRTRHDMLNRVSKSLYMTASGSADISDECRKRLYDLRTGLRVVLIKLKNQELNENGEAEKKQED